MRKNKEGWGAVLRGEATDIEDWVHALGNDFDPWIEKRGNETVLRSDTITDLESAEEVRARSLDMIDYLNGAVALSQGTSGPVSFAGTIRFDSDGRARRTTFAEMAAYELSDKALVIGQVLDSSGNPAPPVPMPSEVQTWAAIADNDRLLQEALACFGNAPTWFNIYKALECLFSRFGGEMKFLELEWEPQAEITLLRRSANMARHAKHKTKPPKKPKTLREARSLLSKLLRRALAEARANPRDESDS
jgi:hypothetical protein